MMVSEVKNTPKVTFILNICSIIMGVFAIFNIYTSYKHISNLILQGFEPSKQLAEVINYYLISVTPYVFYGICLFLLGFIIKQISYIGNCNEVCGNTEKSVVEQENDDIVDDILADINSKYNN